MTDREKWALFGVLLLIVLFIAAAMIYLGEASEDPAVSGLSYAQP
jgi:flagellar biosynthesis/type III secretory pathway M-ring protein FliF/YscJ